jgi:hypothetical protein
MEQNNKYDELKGLNSNLPEQNPVPYAVPDGYFDNLAENILSRVKISVNNSSASEEIAALSNLLADVRRTMPYSIPEQYFESTLNDLPLLIRNEEESAILSAAGKSVPYQVPVGYFNQLEPSILKKVGIHNSGSGRVVRMKWMRLAAAAVITGIISVSGFFYLSHQPGTVIKNPVAQQLKNISTKDLEDFLKNNDPLLTNSATAQNASKTTEVSKMVQDVPDKDLDAFLKQIPADEEIMTN